MTMPSLQDCVDREIEEILQKCTRCGRCAEVCPIIPHTAANGTDPRAIVQGVLGLLRGEAGNAAAVAWTEACAGSGVCIQACPEQVNPRGMLVLARNVVNARAGDGKFKGHFSFKSMGETTRVLAGIQVDPETMKRLTGRQDVRSARAKVVFWIGCNLPRTSHLVLTLEDVFEVLGLDCEVIGGLNNCCGVVHFGAGDNETSGKIATNLKRTVEGLNPEILLSWCPSCQIHYDEHLRRFRGFECRVEHVSKFLVDQLDLLAEKWVTRVEKKVAIHEHTGLDGAAENIRKIVAAIPGVSVVEVEQLSQYGYMCSRLDRAPEAKMAAHRKILEGARAAGVEILVTPYHNCQRDLCIEERNYPFEVKNFVTLLGEALGIERYEDKYKKFRILGDVEKIVEEAAPFIQLNRLDPATARRVISKELLKKSE